MQDASRRALQIRPVGVILVILRNSRATPQAHGDASGEASASPWVVAVFSFRTIVTPRVDDEKVTGSKSIACRIFPNRKGGVHFWI